MDISLHLVQKQWFLGTRIKTSPLLRFKWPCVYPSLYGDVPPVSTRIISHVWRVLTSFVPPIHNQGVSLAPLQGHALWKIFLPTTGSYFVNSVTDCFYESTLRRTFTSHFHICRLLSFIANQPLSWLNKTIIS